MIAVALYSRKDVKAKLQELDCKFAEHLDDRNDLYTTDKGVAFTVPALGDDGMCARVVLHDIVERLKSPQA